MRISTASLFQQGLAAMRERSVEIARSQQQVASGLRLRSAGDDPVAFAAAIGLDRALAELEQLERNSTLIGSRLETADAALGQIGDRLLRVRELALQASNDTNSSSDRAAIATELREQLAALVQQANTVDGDGRYVFAGGRDSSPPFAFAVGVVSYSGDQVQRRLDVGPEIAVDDVDAGSEIFLRIRNGNGVFSARADTGNSGTGRLAATGVTDPTAWDDGSYRVVFNAGNWQALDAGNVVVASAAYSAGAPIEFRGARLVIEGVPADGDRFDVGPARSQDLFSTVQNLIDGLVQPSVTPAQRTAQRNAIFTSLEDLDRAQQHLLDVRAGIGARLNVIDGADAEREASDVQLRTTLSELRDVDLAEAISRLELEMTALEAAQQSFIRIQSLSLFQFLR